MESINLDCVKCFVCVCEGHQEKVNVLQFHPQAKSLLASSGYDCKLLLWDLSSHSVALSLECSSEPVCYILLLLSLSSGYYSSSAWRGVLMELNWQHSLKITL